MAAKQPSKLDELEEILICSLCLDILKSPKTLPCTISFCAGCLKKHMDVKTADERNGIHCPLCKSFSKHGKARGIYQLEKLLELYWKCTKGIILPCVMCENKKNKVIWKCTDCKVNLCEECQRMHNKLPHCKTHQCILYKSDTEEIIDLNHFCKVHPDHILALYCTECKQIICVKCKVTNHDKHTSQTMEKLVISVIANAEIDLMTVQNNIKVLQDDNTSLKQKVD